MNQVASTVMLPREEYIELVRQRDELLLAIENLIKVKGRHHTEQAYQRLVETYDKVKP